MPSRKPRRRIGGADEGVLPLINVVFLLLIFFLVAGRLDPGEPFRIAPVRAAIEGPGPDAAPLLLIGADGALALDGAGVTRADLPAALRGVARLGIKADAAADSLAVVGILAELQAAGLAEARLMTTRRP